MAPEAAGPISFKDNSFLVSWCGRKPIFSFYGRFSLMVLSCNGSQAPSLMSRPSSTFYIATAHVSKCLGFYP